MKINKSHFRYSKSQRNGILLFIVVIVLQITLFFLKRRTTENAYQVAPTAKKLQAKLDSMMSTHQKKTFEIYPFNPNYLSDYRAYQLGMSVQEIDRLLAYRTSNKYINSAQEFQKVTKVSDSLLLSLSPYFKFPDWVSQQNKVKFVKKKTKLVVKDINTATIKELTKIKGIGTQRAKRIVNYRKLLGGYTYASQLEEVWGIPTDVLKLVQQEFKVLSKPNIKSLDVNKASIYDLTKIVYIDKKLAISIVEYRKEVAEIQKISELKRIRDFPLDKFNLISLYLHAY